MALASGHGETPIDGARRRLRTCIGALMGAKRVSRRRMAAEIGLSEMQLGRRLNGHQQFSEDDLAMIADYFGVSVGDLYNPERVLSTLAYKRESAGTRPELSLIPGRRPVSAPTQMRLQSPVTPVR